MNKDEYDGNGATRLCWHCLLGKSNPIHDSAAHDDCPATCTHHSYEYEPSSRTDLLTHVGALLSELERARKRIAEIDAREVAFTNEFGNHIRITIEGPNSIAENLITPTEAAHLRELLNLRTRFE